MTRDGSLCRLDISDEQTHLCLVEPGGSVVRRGHCATDPDASAKTLSKRVNALSAFVSMA